MRYKKASWQQWQTWILNMQVSCAALYSSREWTKWVRTEAPSQMTDSWEIPKVAWSLQEDTSVSHCDSDVKAHPGVFGLTELPDPKMLFTSAELFIYFMYFFIYFLAQKCSTKANPLAFTTGWLWYNPRNLKNASKFRRCSENLTTFSFLNFTSLN